MKKNLLIALVFLLTTAVGYAQLIGVKTIPGDYNNIASAIDALNEQGVGTGGVTFNVTAGYTETFTTSADGIITTITSSESNPIFFMKSGTGPNPIITAALHTGSAETDGVFILSGTDYVTFDGIDVQENTLNTGNKTEWGYAVLMASSTDASQFISIRNCSISLDKTNLLSKGIYSNIHGATSSTTINPTSPTGVVSYCNVDNCNISNAYFGISFTGFNSPAPYNLYGQMNHFGHISGNSITNFGGSSVAAHAIYTQYQNDLIVKGNTINGGIGSTALLGGIYNSISHNANVTISNNTITLESSSTINGAMYALGNIGSGTASTNTINISDNIIENCTQIAGTDNANWYMIYNGAKALTTNINGNIIRNNTKAASGGSIYMINLAGSSTGTENIYDNQIYGNSVIQPNQSVFSAMHCFSSALVKNIYNNLIYDNVVTSSSIYGINSNGGTEVSIYQNKIYNQSTSNSGPALNYGLRIGSGTNVNAYNNVITDLTAPASISNFALRGISAEAATNINLFYNTVYLNGLSGGANFGSTCVYASVNPVLDMRNNILINTSVPYGTGRTIAYWRTNTSFNNYAATSNNNCLFAGVPSPQNLIFYDGVNSIESFADYKSFAQPAESASFTEFPPFVNSTITPYDLHINGTIPTQCESGASIISSPLSITNDFDFIARYPNTGYPNNPAHPAFAPDAGAYEFAGIYIDLSAPAISYALLSNTSQTTSRTITATITDVSGVPVTGTGLPVCYWSINSGTYMVSQGVHIPGTNNYTFVLGGGVVTGDVVSYYFVAQDMAPSPNIGASPSSGSAGFSSNPPSCSTPPTTPNIYYIVPALSGNVTVGVGGTYPSLTGAGGLFQDINSKALTGNLTATIISDLTEDGSNALLKWTEDAPGNFTVTIKPDAAIERVIEGNVPYPMIRFSGSKHATIDGRYNGAGKYLRFRNLNTTFGSFELANGAQNDTIRDCIWEGAATTSNPGSMGIIRISTSNEPNGNNHNVILDNVVRNMSDGSGEPYVGIFAIGSSTVSNSHNLISGNEIMNFTAYGIYISANNEYCTISGNSFFNNMSTPTTTTIRSINISGGSGSVGNVIAGNYIGGSFPMCAGPAWVHNSPGGMQGINISVGTTVPTEIYNNVFANIHSIHTGSGSFYGINCSTGAYHIGNLGANIIGSASSSNSIVFDGTNAFYGIYITSSDPQNTVENNVIGNITWTAASGSQSAIRGLFVYSAKVSRNKIFNIGGAQPGFSPTIYGIYNNGISGSMVNEFSNNIIDLDGGLSENPTIYGFYEHNTNSVANLYFNTINIHGPATVSSSTYAYRRSVVNISVIKNNIIFNNRTSGGSGKHYAIYDEVTASLESDHNNLFSTSGSFGFFNGSDVSNIADWQTVTSGDINSVSENPDFVSANDLHPQNTNLNGLGIAIAEVTNDFYGITRASTPDAGVYEWSVNITDYHTLPATFVAETTAQLNGDLNSNGEVVETYLEWGLTTSYGNLANIAGYGVPPTIRTTTLTQLHAELTGLAPYTTYHFRLYGVPQTSSQGVIYGEDLTFTTLAFPATVTTLQASELVGPNATLNGTVNANDTDTDVRFEWGLTTAYGNTIAAIPSTVSGNTTTHVSAQLTGLEQGATYHFRCVGVSPGGTIYGNDVMFISDCPPPSTPGSISGPQSICKNSTGVVYSVNPVAGASGYNWFLPTGVNIVDGENTNIITVDFTDLSVSGDISVEATNNCGPGNAVSLSIVVFDLPAPTINGPTSLCVGSSGHVYTTEATMSNYLWSVTGGTITDGLGTNSIVVTWDTAGDQEVMVNYQNSNGCSASIPGSFQVLVDSLPVPTISGPNQACESTAYLDYSTEAGMTNYVWDMSPNSGTITLTGTNVVTIFWNSPGTKWVSVSYTNANGCTSSTATVYNVTVNPLPVTPGSISGETLVCAGSSGVSYNVDMIENATSYTWTLPEGAVIASGENTNHITVDYGITAIPGTISVRGTNECGSGIASELEVMVNAKPQTPVISQDLFILTSDAPTGNQWYRDNVLIPDATDAIYEVTENGAYTVIVTINGCSSDISNEILILNVANQFIGLDAFSIYPNPTNGEFWLSVSKTGKYKMIILNSLGVIVYENSLVLNGSSGQFIDLNNLSSGLYSIYLKSDYEILIGKFVVKN